MAPDRLSICSSPDTSGDFSLALLGDRLDAVARVREDTIAIVDGQRRLSYRELLLRADALAGELEAIGIGPGDFVAVALPRSADLVVAVVGVVRAGAAYVPIDFSQPAERRALILSDARPKLIVTGDAQLIEGIPLGMHVIQLPQDVPERIERRRRPGLEDPAYVIYTSGSTGQPKGVVVTQRNAARLFTVTEPLFRFDANDVWTLFHSIGFDVSVWELWGALLHGCRLVVVPAPTARAADAFHALVLREGVTVLCQTPSAFRAFDAADAAAGRPANQLAHLVFAGEALDPRSLKGWFEAHGDDQPHVANMYGITETTVHATYRRMLTRDAEGSGRSLIGAALADLRIDLLGQDGRPVALGEVGEIFVAGDGVSAGYLGRPELTAERFLPDVASERPNARLYRSGDLARRTPDGDLEYLGRIDNQVKLRGFRIELGEIEMALCKAADVREAVVALRNSPITGPQLVAYVVQHNNGPIEPGSLRQHVAQRLPEYMVPAAYVRIQHVPRTSNDKVDRAALPPPTATDYPSAGAGSFPRDDWERAVAQIFSEVLDTSVTGRESDFFQLGGDSLLAVRVVISCQERLDVDLPMSAILENPTVMALADHVRREKNLGHVARRAAHVPRGGAIPLSPQQFALWLDLKIRPDVDAYNETLAFRVQRRLDPARLVRALAQLAQAHEVLRGRLIEVDGEPKFVFDRTASAVEFEFLDAGGSDKLTEASHRPFDLHEGPLWRALLCNEPDGGSVLMLVVHHIILDHASEEILLGELIANYSDGKAQPTARAYDFADLAVHERVCLASELEALEDFWAKNLAGAKLTLDLPPPCVPSSPESEDLACISRRDIEPALAQRVRDLAASWGLTPYQLYLTAYLTLLRKYTASDDLVIGSPLSLRDTPLADGVVGYLLSPAALRVQLAGDRSFRETAEDVAFRWREVCAHARLPTHRVLNAALGAQRTGIGSPVQTFFSLTRDLTDRLLLEGCALQQVHIAPAHAKFNLFLLVLERQKDASLVLEYRRGTFDPEMANRFLGHLEVLLLAATENPNSSLAKLPLADQAELAQLREWGTHSTSYPRDRTVADIFEEVAREYRDNTAIVAGGERISYAALDCRANAVAAVLRRAGVREGDRVPLLLPRGVQFIACALGVMKCGAAYVPLDPWYPAERLRRMLEELDARIGLGTAGLSIGNGAIDWLDLSTADEASTIPVPSRQIGATSPAYVMFTSGSTGRPKGVEIPHRAIVRLVFGQHFARMGSAETWLHMAPTSFDASTLEIWAPLLHGGRCVIYEERTPTPPLIGEIIRRESVTSAWITSSLFNLIVDEAPACLSGLNQILIGGEALSTSHVRRAFDHLPGVRLVNGYGPTENTTFTSCHVISREDVEPSRKISIGRPIANTTVHVLDFDGSLAAVGVPGELVAGGDGVALGYIGQPEQTQHSFLPDAFSKEPGARLYRTGDHVRWGPDGRLEFLGRHDNQVKIRGHRVELDEVAACLAELDSVAQVVVVVHRTAAGASQLVACVVPKSENYSAPEVRKLLIRHAAESLPAYMVPAKIFLFDELPLTRNGKLDFAALEEAQHESIPAREEDALLSSTQSRVLGLMRELLHRPDLGPDADFFENGGDSFLAIELMLRLDSVIGRRLPARALDAAFTSRRLAAFLDSPSGLSPNNPAGVVGIRAGTKNRPLFCLPGLGGTAFQIRALAARWHTSRPIHAIELHNLQVDASILESMERTATTIIERMREVQPTGPYAVFGFSFGGNLAIEVARQLIANDQIIELAIIVDAYAPGALRIPSRLEKIAMHLRVMGRKTPYDSYMYLMTRIRRRLFQRFPTSPPLNQANLLPKSELERQLAELSEQCTRAHDAHRPEIFSGRIVLISATDREDGWVVAADPSGANGWKPICKGGVDVITMACRHLDFFHEPHITTLAEHIDGLLKAN